VAAGNLAELPGWALDLLRDERVGHLGLLDDQDRPRVLPVTFALAGNRLYIAVDEKPKRVPGEQLARIRYLRRRSCAALTVDHYDEDWSTLAWVQVLGTVQVLDDPSAQPNALAALRSKYQPYRDRPLDGPLLQLTPTRALHWRANTATWGGS
jgi:PPOX class probable F420-dependent enzyme